MSNPPDKSQGQDLAPRSENSIMLRPEPGLAPKPDERILSLSSEYDTGVKAFMRAFGGWWLTAMCGPLSVPVAIIGILWTTGVLRIAFCALAFVAWIGSSWW